MSSSGCKDETEKIICLNMQCSMYVLKSNCNASWKRPQPPTRRPAAHLKPRVSLDFFLSVQRFVSNFQLPLTKKGPRALCEPPSIFARLRLLYCAACAPTAFWKGARQSQGQAGAKEGHEGPRRIARAENPVIHFLQASSTWCCYCVWRNKSSIKLGDKGDAPYQIGYLSFGR